MATITGGCLCGAVRYTAEADTVRAGVCHCRDCQKFTGSAFATVVMAPKEGVTFSGSLKTFSSVGGSGKPILRHFCPECGSSIAEEPGTRPGMVILNVGTFDDPAVGNRRSRSSAKTRCPGSRCKATSHVSRKQQGKRAR